MTSQTPQPPPPRRRRSLNRLWPWALLVGAIGLWTFAEPGHGGLPHGEAAPDLAVPWTEGPEGFRLASERGRVVVLAFWATWCPACRSEGPVLSRVEERLAPFAERVVGVSVDAAPLPAVRDAAIGFGMTYPIALATRSDLDRFRVDRLPTIYVVAPDGSIADSFVGPASEDAIVAAVEAARDPRVSEL